MANKKNIRLSTLHIIYEGTENEAYLYSYIDKDKQIVAGYKSKNRDNNLCGSIGKTKEEVILNLENCLKANGLMK